MKENNKTYIYVAVAAVLLLIAFISSPNRITPEAFLDQNEAFYPDFTDPNEATTLEVISFDEASGTAHPFKVTFKNGLWTIPSHHDYPADAKEQLAKTAAGVIDIKKDEFRTDNVSEHAKLGVIDPMSETAGLTGRGQRITIRGAQDQILADFIVGKPVEGRTNYRYVRLPDQNRVYAVKMDLELSTKFTDWIDSNLLEVEAKDIEKIDIENYSINERTKQMVNRDNLILTKKDEQWSANRSNNSKMVDTLGIDSLLTALTSLEIIGVRPKPSGFSQALAGEQSGMTMTNSEVLKLQQIGFYISHDGQLISNEGELNIYTDKGVIYTMHFGEVTYGSGLSLTAGIEDESGQKDESKAARYIFITARFNDNYFKAPKKPANNDFITKDKQNWSKDDKINADLQEKFEAYQNRVNRGKEISAELNRRYADWYYVISEDSFKKIRVERSDIIVNK